MDGAAPSLVTAKAPAALANLIADCQSSPRAILTANAPQTASPAAVVSTASTD